MKTFRDWVHLWLKALRLGLCTAGPMFFLFAAGFAARTEYFLQHSHSTTGEIVKNLPIPSALDTSFAPVFTFAAQDGRIYTVTSGNSSNPPAYRVGEQVRVLYIPSDPASARLDSYWQLWGLETAFAIGGAAGTLAGYGWLSFLRFRRRGQLASVS